MLLVVSIVSLMFSFLLSLPSPPTFHIDKPEYGPGAIFGASGVYTSSASTSATASSTSSHSGGHAGPIAGGVIGGIALILIAVAAIFYLRRRRSRAASADVGASQYMTNDGVVAQSSSGSPVTMRFYVRVFMSHAAAVMYPHAPFSYCFHTPRTQMTQLRSRDTNLKAVHNLWTSLQFFKYLCHRTSDPESRCQTCRPRRPMPGVIMVYPCPVLDPAL